MDSEAQRPILTPFGKLIEVAVPIVGNMIAGAVGGAILGFFVGLIPGLANNDDAAFTVIAWCAVFGAGFGLAKWNYTRNK